MVTQNFISKAKQIHGDKYDYSKVNYINAHTKVCIICPEHGEFWQIPNSHLNGCGCSICGENKKKKYAKKRNLISKENFISKAKQIHGDKYDYSKVEYIDSQTKVCIICPKHGEFWQIPNSHLNGCGCEKCSYLLRGQEKINKAKEKFIEKARKIHGDRYDYSKVEYKNAKTKICIICPIHGEFWQTPTGHLSGKGCAKCCTNIKPTTEEFIKRAKTIHGDKYDYSKVEYINNHTKVCIICPIHGEFWQTPAKHLISKHGCSKCNESHLEKEVRVMLEDNNIEYIYQANKKIFPWLGQQSFDFYLPQYNIAIECQGEQHYVETNFGNWGKFEQKDRLLYIMKLDNHKKELAFIHDVELIYYTNEKLKTNQEFTSLNELLTKINNTNLFIS